MTTINPNIFRKYDIRGVATGDSPDLTPEVAELVGKAYGTHMKRSYGTSRVYIGCDNRETSEPLKAAMTDGMLSTGMEVIDVGVVLTPTVYFAASQCGEDCGGIMITGSHLAIKYNGIKLAKGRQCLAGDEIFGLYRLIEAGDFEIGQGRSESDPDMIRKHLDTIKGKVRLGNRKLKVVVDAGNAMAGEYIPPIYRELGIEVVCLYCDPDPTFPNHLPNPEVPELMADLQKAVLENEADIGIGFDGDADRCGIVDDKGNLISADRLTALLARDLLGRHPGAKIVFDVKSSQAVIDFVNANGGQAVMWKAGHSLMKQKMAEIGALLGGEVSGHIFIGEDYYGFDDAPLVSLKMLELLSRTDKPCSELFDEIPRLEATPEIILPTPDEVKFKIVEEVRERLRKRYQVIDVDGARVIFDDGWGLVRASNTHGALTMRFEARTREHLLRYMAELEKELEKYPQVDLTELRRQMDAIRRGS